MRKRLKKNDFLLLAPLILSGALLSCRQYQRDRWDESQIGEQENRHNLYRNRPETMSAEHLGFDRAVVMDTYVVSGLKPDMTPVEKALSVDSYSILTVSRTSREPLLSLYKVEKEGDASEPQKTLLFSVPLDSSNSIITKKDPSGETYACVVSLRMRALIPFVQDDNYDLFKITLNRNHASGSWLILAVERLTNSSYGYDSTQPVLDRNKLKAYYVRRRRGGEFPSLWSIPLTGNPGQETHSTLLAENAEFPHLLPDGKVLFVKRDKGFIRDFYIYSDSDSSTVKATPDTIAASSRDGTSWNFEKRLIESIDFPGKIRENTFSFHDLMIYGLRRSPEVYKGYMDYIQATQNSKERKFDLGADFFLVGNYQPVQYILTKDNNVNYGDAISTENFLRLTGGLTVPIIPNIPLRQSISDLEKAKVLYAKAMLQKSVNTYLNNMMKSCLDYAEGIDNIKIVMNAMSVNQKRIDKLTELKKIGEAYNEKLLAAEMYQDSLRHDLSVNMENVFTAQFKIQAAAGINCPDPISIYPLPEHVMLNKNITPKIPDLGYFQAQAQLNRPEIQALDAMIAQAAAERDMGPEATRIDSLKMSVSYGIGMLHWTKFVDDFLLLTAAYVQPLRLPQLYHAYYGKWTAKAESLHNEKYNIQGDIRSNVQEAYMDMKNASSLLHQRSKRYDLLREQERISCLYKYNALSSFNSPATTADNDDNIMEVWGEKLRLSKNRYDEFRGMLRVCTMAGRADLAFPVMENLFMNSKSPSPYADMPATGTYLRFEGACVPDFFAVASDKPRRDRLFQSLKGTGVTSLFLKISAEDILEDRLKKLDWETDYFIDLCTREGISPYLMIDIQDFCCGRDFSLLMKLIASYRKYNRAMISRGGSGFHGICTGMSVKAKNESESKALINTHVDALRILEHDIGKSHLQAVVPYDIAETYYMLDAYYIQSIAGLVSGITISAQGVSSAQELNRITGLLKKYPSTNYSVMLDSAGDIAKINTSEYPAVCSTYENLPRMTMMKDPKKESTPVGKQREATMPERTSIVKNGIYIWNTFDVILNDKNKKEFLEFCEKHNIRKVFAMVEMFPKGKPHLVQHEKEFKSFLADADALGISIYALMGEPDWIREKDRGPLWIILESYLAFNRKQRENSAPVFAGIHLDVEPHSEPDWEMRKPELIDQYLQLLKQISDHIGREDLNVSVSYSYNTQKTASGQNLLALVSEMVNGITIMAYMNKVTAIEAKVIPVLERKDIKCAVDAAIETEKLEEEGVSFYGIPADALRDTYNYLDVRFREYPNYAGFVYHNYHSYKKYLEEHGGK